MMNEKKIRTVLQMRRPRSDVPFFLREIQGVHAIRGGMEKTQKGADGSKRGNQKEYGKKDKKQEGKKREWLMMKSC